MLTLTFLGAGSAFARRNFQSNVLIEAWTRSVTEQNAPDDVLLLDFGTTGPLALYQLVQRCEFAHLRHGDRTDYGKIHKVFITHLHADHVGGVEELAVLTRYACTIGGGRAASRKPLLFLGHDLLETIWTNVLRGGLSAMNGRSATLEDYFRPVPLGPTGEGYEGFALAGGYRVEIFRTHHVQIARKYDWPSYGLVFHDEKSGDGVVYSGDTQFDPEGLLPRFQRASIIFHDAMLERREGAVHASVEELRTLPEDVRRKMTLYHYEDNWDAPAFDFVATEFAGFARPQRRYTLFE